MRRLTSLPMTSFGATSPLIHRVLLLLLLTALLLPARPADANWWWPFGDTLVTIDGAEHSTQDFKAWWRFWNDEGLEAPRTPDDYIDWLLLVREAERMELADDPSFQRQTRVFLTARTLLMLENDAINSQIKVTEANVQERYAADYLPRWLLERLNFEDEAQARAAWQAIQDGEMTVDELLAKEPEDGGPASRNEQWLRPMGVDSGWVEIFASMEAGELLSPEDHTGGALLYHLKDVKGGDPFDLDRVRESVERDIWKQQENELTVKLINDLSRKYQVEIDEERLAAMDLGAPDETFTDAVIVATNRQNLTERDLMTMARREMGISPQAAHAHFDKDLAKDLKQRVVEGFISQSLTNWESLDRGYEKQEPFKSEYEFNLRHRLTVTLEQRLFTQTVKITDEEVRQHYEQNLSRYSRPAQVRLNIITSDDGPVSQVWADVMAGKTFPQAMQEHLGRRVPNQEIPFNHLDPRVRGVVEKLAAGETSAPFTAHGGQVVVHLLDRVPETPLPFDRVAGTIREQLTREKTAQQRQAYLNQLRSRSQIEVSARNWRSVRLELGGAQ